MAAYLDTRNTIYCCEPTAIVHGVPFCAGVLSICNSGFLYDLWRPPLRILLPAILSVAIVLVLV